MDKEKKPSCKNKGLNKGKFVAAIIYLLILLAVICFFHQKYKGTMAIVVQGVELILAFLALHSIISAWPVKKRDVQNNHAQKKLGKRTIVSALAVLIAVPITIFIGMYFLGDRKYFFISVLIIIETLLPFFIRFESKKPQAKELIIISVLCAIAVAGRTVFYMIPQFKPMAAIVIIAGVAFGAEAGFLVGAVSAFVSNMFFGQGAWTPWQMFAFGIIGFLAGIVFNKGLLKKQRAALAIFGGVAVILIYGGLMNASGVLMYQANPNPGMILSAIVLGVPFDLIHAASTSFFLWFIAEPFLEKLERISTKYGIKI